MGGNGFTVWEIKEDTGTVLNIVTANMFLEEKIIIFKREREREDIQRHCVHMSVPVLPLAAMEGHVLCAPHGSFGPKERERDTGPRDNPFRRVQEQQSQKSASLSQTRKMDIKEPSRLFVYIFVIDFLFRLFTALPLHVFLFLLCCLFLAISTGL